MNGKIDILSRETKYKKEWSRNIITIISEVLEVTEWVQ